MVQQSENDDVSRRCYALCVGIGTYSKLSNRDLRYAVADATVIADRLADPRRGNFVVTVLSQSLETTKEALDEAVTQALSAPGRRPEDLALLYFSCHGDADPTDDSFCLLPSNASLQADGQYDSTTLIRIADFARWFANATIQNVVVFLDVCHSGGAGATLQRFKLKLATGPNFFFIGAARVDQAARQSSQLQHGLFTHCLLRAFEQPPTADGWLTVSQIHTFISDELPWFTKEHPTQIQSWSVSVNPNLPLIRNPGYPELAPLPPVWNVPLQRNVVFTGQEDLLSQLAGMLQGTQKTALTQPHALSGLGGIGKTQLALEYAYRHRQGYHAVLWGRAESTETLISTFLEIAQVLDLPQKDEADQTIIVEAVKTWLSHRPQWLFILDNADDVGLVQTFLPPTFRGHLLLTTRAQSLGKIVESKLEVEAMRPEIGALLLLRRARKVTTMLEEASDEEMTRAKALAEELGGLPLALDQAGAYIDVTNCSLADYQQQYQTRRTALLALRNGPALPGAWRDDHPEPVATTWSLSFAKVEQASPIAAELLRACAFLAPDAIPEELLVEVLQTPVPTSGMPKKQRKRGVGFSHFTTGQLDEMVALLRAYSLVQRNPQEKLISVHRLVQAVLREAMGGREQQTWEQRILRAVGKALPAREFANWKQCEQYAPHAEACTQLVDGVSDVEKARVWHWLGAYRLVRNRTQDAGLYMQQALMWREKHLGNAHLETAESLDGVAEWQKHQENYTKAEPLYLRALAIYEQQLGASHPDTARCLNHLAWLYQKQEKYAEAEPLLVRVLTIYEQQLGASHPDTASSLNNLAAFYGNQGKYAEAEPLYVRALQIVEEQLGASHPDTAQCLNNLAWLYYSQGKYAQAEPLYMRALAINEQQLGPEHFVTAQCLNNLAMLYMNQGMFAKAEPLLVRALAIREQQLGVSYSDTASSLNNLAILYLNQEEYTKAEPLLVRALAIYEQQLGDSHSSTAGCLNNLATLYMNQGSYARAEPLLARALAICEQQLGHQHPTTLFIQANYTTLLEAMQ